MNKIRNIQALRGIAVLAVVLFHLLDIEGKYGGGPGILPQILQFGMFGVDLFFIISGFVMVTVTRGKFQSLRHSLDFLAHRVTRIYPPYWFYSLLVLAVFIFKPAWVNSSQHHQVNILFSFLLWPTYTLPLILVAWSLIHEIYFYLVFTILLPLVPEKRLTLALGLWTGIVVLLHPLFPQTINPVILVIRHPMTLEFIGGCLLAILYHQQTWRLPARPLLILSCAVFLGMLVVYHFFFQLTGEIEPLQWRRLAVFGLPALLLVFNAAHVERQGLLFPSLLEKIGDASYSIYLSHILTLNAAGRLWRLAAQPGIHDNIIMTPLLLILACGVGLMSYQMIEKPLIRFSHRHLSSKPRTTIDLPDRL